MARTLTGVNSKLGVWDDGDNPHAGTKGIRVDQGGTGLNANWESLDMAVFTEHNVDGTHKDGAITGVKLKQTSTGAVVDGSTLEFNSNQMRIKDGGITASKIGTNAIATGNIQDDAIDASKLKDDVSTDSNRAVTTNHIRDAAITNAKIASNSIATANIQDDAVDASKLKDDASTDSNRAVTTNHIRDAAITTAKIASQAITSDKLAEDLGWQWIYGDLRVAGTSAGNTPASITEWNETSSSPVDKFSFFLPQLKSGSKKFLRIRGNAKTNNASKAWTIQLTDKNGGLLSSDTGVNTSYNASTSEIDFSYQITDGSGFDNIEYQIKMSVASGGTASMKNLAIFVTRTLPIVS